MEGEKVCVKIIEETIDVVGPTLRLDHPLKTVFHPSRSVKHRDEQKLVDVGRVVRPNLEPKPHRAAPLETREA